MKIGKRPIILASLIAALGAATYLNWQFADNKGLNSTKVFDTSDELGEARYVNNINFSEKEELSNVSEKTSKYFAEAQIRRQKAHEETEEKLKRLISTPNINSEAKESINNSIESLAKNISQESNIENLIKSKGFDECLAFIQNDECSIVVNPGSVNENSIVIIKDIVCNQTNISNNKIKIIEAKQ